MMDRQSYTSNFICTERIALSSQTKLLLITSHLRNTAACAPHEWQLVDLSRAGCTISPHLHLYRKRQELGYSKPGHIYPSKL